ncbi:MAG: type II/IV secretion system ATPase subunit [Candidatus Woesearchaeota archaeon]
MAFSFFGKKKTEEQPAVQAAGAGKQVPPNAVPSAPGFASAAPGAVSKPEGLVIEKQPAAKPNIIFSAGNAGSLKANLGKIAHKAAHDVDMDTSSAMLDESDRPGEKKSFIELSAKESKTLKKNAEDEAAAKKASEKAGEKPAVEKKGVAPLKVETKGEEESRVSHEAAATVADDAALAAPGGENAEEAGDEEGTGKIETKEGFYIDTHPKIIKLPPYDQRRTLNVRYPLIPPYAYAHIYWDDEQNELIYSIEEPVLDETERELLELVNLGLEEMINISFVRAAKSHILLQYLEKNVQSILVELGTKVNRKTYHKIMYYVYRNSVGLNEIEPLLNDYYVEDIECNGCNFPLYIVHRVYQNIKSTVEFKDLAYMTDFVEKLAQKTGRYISYAKPLLDGTLPDGSRVNATYTEDVTTRGPTFTIRKFTKEPWTPVHLIKSKTVTAEAFAYLWLVIEHKFNMMVVGETASGKTTFLNCIVDFIPPEARICSIEDTRELNLAHINWLPAVTRAGFGATDAAGIQFGEITLFDLLRESFRQNPDYVIVGEIRGKEAYVLFQGMASGHPSFSTFHAASVDTVVKRLETPPINLSPSLVEALDVVCICIHVKDQERNVRRLKEVDEIIGIEQALGKANYNAVFEFDPASDKIIFNGKPTIFERIIKKTGMTYAQLKAEMDTRTALLNKMVEQNISNFEKFNEVVNNYYKDPNMVRKQFGIK